MSRRAAQRDAWLSLTPEPESELPQAVATLRAQGPPTREAVRAETDRIERLVLRGDERRWLAYLGEVVALVEGAAPPGPAGQARAIAAEVVLNHHMLLLGLPGDGAERAAADRAKLSENVQPHRNGVP